MSRNLINGISNEGEIQGVNFRANSLPLLSPRTAPGESSTTQQWADVALEDPTLPDLLFWEAFCFVGIAHSSRF
jgi:hypothetical protein